MILFPMLFPSFFHRSDAHVYGPQYNNARLFRIDNSGHQEPLHAATGTKSNAGSIQISNIRMGG